MSHVTDLFCRFSFCFREHMISFCLSWNRNTALICSGDDASAICEGKQTGPGGAPLLVFFFSQKYQLSHGVKNCFGWLNPDYSLADICSPYRGIRRTLVIGISVGLRSFSRMDGKPEALSHQGSEGLCSPACCPPLERRTRHQRTAHIPHHTFNCAVPYQRNVFSDLHW